MNNWPKVALSEIARIGAGNSAPQDKKLFENGVFPFIRTGDVGAIRFGEIHSSNDLLNETGTQGLRIWPPGTILLPKSGASTFLNHRVIMGAEGFVASHLATVVPDAKKVIGRYLLYYLHTVRAQDIIQDQNYPSLRLPEIGSISVPVPPLEEQKRIVAILDEAFEGIAKAIANAERNLANTRELFDASLNQTFEEGGVDWLEGPLGAFVTIKHGFAFKSEYFSDAGEHVLLTPGNFFERGGYRDRGPKQKFYTGPIPDGFVLAGGSLLVAMTEQAAGLLGSPLIVPESDTFLHNQRLGLVQPLPNVPWVPELFEHLFNTKRFRDKVHKDGTGVKVRHTSPNKLRSVIVRVPPNENEQFKVASRLSNLRDDCDELEIQYQRRIELAEELRSVLLGKAFSGELTSAKSRGPIVELGKLVDTASPQYTADVLAFAYAKHRTAQRERTLGRVKGQKVLHLVEAVAGVDLGRDPVKDAAGPNDSAHMRRAEDWAAQQDYFAFEARVTGGYDFRPGRDFDKTLASAYARLSTHKDAIAKVIDLLVPLDSQEAEVLATVHAAWNNLIIDGIEPTRDAIIAEARENWAASKLDIPVAKFEKAIRFIRQNSIIPDGSAKAVRARQESLF